LKSISIIFFTLNFLISSIFASQDSSIEDLTINNTDGFFLEYTWLYYMFAFMIMILIFIIYRASILKKQNIQIQKQNELIAKQKQELQEQYKKLEIQNKKFEESNEFLQQFAFTASHDLQEPLRMISGHLQLIERRYGDLLDEKGKKFLWFATDGASRMQKLIQGLLSFSRVQTTNTPMEEIDLNNILNDALSNLEIKIKETNAQITTDKLPVVFGDKVQLTQVFQNLISNAIKFTPDKQPIIKISNQKKSNMYEFCIEDNGIGFDEKYSNKMFQIFQRLNKKEEFSGEGIGLALCKRIINRHKGDIWATSIEAKGSKFFFSLPLCEHYQQKD
jgi:light-regulated signal transduction histidine kinase (bacteriophytochrome)